MTSSRKFDFSSINVDVDVDIVVPDGSFEDLSDEGSGDNNHEGENSTIHKRKRSEEKEVNSSVGDGVRHGVTETQVMEPEKVQEQVLYEVPEIFKAIFEFECKLLTVADSTIQDVLPRDRAIVLQLDHCVAHAGFFQHMVAACTHSLRDAELTSMVYIERKRLINEKHALVKEKSELKSKNCELERRGSSSEVAALKKTAHEVELCTSEWGGRFEA
ncbi:hypothetical protein AQUCO_03600135v1 [Aquilegia coerulea]|uniref:Uncharacterized protein n=1 Tax=Aquilegia coerulea TaxID=218851 RepID=A0A2G5CVE6_AQUCA|nr:hypothetical protein AQUCO_03600135v1 [Aquilegia coerulea]